MRRFYKLSFLSVFIIALFGVALFPREVFLKMIEWKMKSAFKHNLQAHLHFEDISWHKGQLHLLNARIKKKGQWEAQIENCHLESSRDRFWIKGENLVLDGVKIIPDPLGSMSIDTVLSMLASSKLQTKITNGLISLPNQTIDWSFDHKTNENQGKGLFHFNFDPSSPELLVAIEHKGEKITLSTHFSDYPLKTLAKGLHPFVKPLFSNPEDSKWEFSDGKVEGNFSCVCEKKNILALQGNFRAENLKGANSAVGVFSSLKELESTFNFDFSSPGKIANWDGEFILKDGSLSFENDSSSLFEWLLDLHVPETKIVVRKGEVTTSKVKATMLGMEGELTLDSSSPNVMMHILFNGSSDKMLPLLPQGIQASFKKAFPNDVFSLAAIVERSTKGPQLTGKLEIVDEKNQTHQLKFGCLFGSEDSRIEFKDAFSKEVPLVLDNLKKQFLPKRRFGWFRGNNLSLEKFLSPFLFDGTLLVTKGLVDIEGVFDDRFLILNHTLQDCVLESPHFSLAIHDVNKKDLPVHYFDFQTKEHSGFLPLRNATYTQKNLQLLFENVSANVHFENKKIEIKEIKTNWNDLDFDGRVDILRIPYTHVCNEESKLPMGRAYHICQQCGLSVPRFEKVDLAISIKSASGPLPTAQRFLSHFNSSYCWQLPLEGTLKTKENGAFFHFLFAPKSKLLEGRVEGEFCAHTKMPFFRLDDYTSNFQYDFQKNQVLLNEGQGKLKTKFFDCDVHVPNISFLDFPKAHMEFEIGLLKQGKEVFHLTGRKDEKLVLESNLFHLNGALDGKSCKIEDFVCGAMKASGTLNWEEEDLYIRNANLLCKDVGQLSFSGKIDRKSWVIKGALSSLYFQLSPLLKMDLLKKWKPHLNLEGEIAGDGNLFLDLAAGTFDCQTLLAFHDLKLGRFMIGDGQKLSCNFSSAQGILLEDLNVEIPGKTPLKYRVGKCLYDPREEKIVLDSCEFIVPNEKIKWLEEEVFSLLPFKLSESFIRLIKELKEDEPLRAKASIEFSKENTHFDMRLEDGSYSLSGKKYELRNIAFHFSPIQLLMEADFCYRDHFYYLNLVAFDTFLNAGQAFLKESKGADETLVFDWVREDTKGLSFKKIKGHFSGLNVSLVENEASSKELLALSGQVNFDGSKVAKLLPEKFAKEFLRWGLGCGYILDGFFMLPKEAIEDISFDGKLHGDNFFLKGHNVAFLKSDVSYRKDYFEMRNVTIDDSAGRLNVEKAVFKKEKDLFSFDIPHMNLENVRPARLYNLDGKSSKKSFFKVLFIPTFELHNLKGLMGQIKTYQGKGELHFANIQKKTLFSNLFLIPTEITARIGLDFSLLVPVQGKIHYEIKEGKVFLLKFKDMYSEGRRSRFYLADGVPSFLDFDGNLNLRVKMKQYNLLMKLAEFFVVTVKGDIFKPSYSLMNQYEEGEVAEDEL